MPERFKDRSKEQRPDLVDIVEKLRGLIPEADLMEVLSQLSDSERSILRQALDAVPVQHSSTHGVESKERPKIIGVRMEDGIVYQDSPSSNPMATASVVGNEAKISVNEEFIFGGNAMALAMCFDFSEIRPGRYRTIEPAVAEVDAKGELHVTQRGRIQWAGN